MASRFPLNPCDYLYYAHDRMMAARRQIGNVTLMMMNTRGEIPPERLRRALQRALRAHPVTRAGIRHTLLSGRPVWVVKDSADDSSDTAYAYDDLRDRPDWRDRVHELCEQRYATPVDIRRGPLVRIDHYAGPDGHAKIALRWPHALMDAEGAQLLLAEIARADADDRDDAHLPDSLYPDGRHIDPLAGRSLGQRWALFRKGFRVHRDYGRVTREGLGDPLAAQNGLGLHARVFELPEVARIQAHARAVCPAGPGIYARYLAGCVIRTLHRIYSARGINTEAYLITLPMSVRKPGPRSVPGNYLVSATLCGRRDRVGDARALAADLHEQLVRFLESDMPLANWALIWFAGMLRAWQYRILLGLPIGLEPYASGFSYYGEIDPPIRRFVGAEVTNLWGATPLSAPPGWNPAFSKFGDRLNFTLTWLRDYIPDPLAAEFAAGIEREALNGPG